MLQHAAGRTWTKLLRLNMACATCRMHPHHKGSTSLMIQTCSLPVVVDENPDGGLDDLATPSCEPYREYFTPDDEVIMHMQAGSHNALSKRIIAKGKFLDWQSPVAVEARAALSTVVQLFQAPPGDAMILFMWQDDFIYACLKKIVHISWPSCGGTRHLISPDLAGKDVMILLLL